MSGNLYIGVSKFLRQTCKVIGSPRVCLREVDDEDEHETWNDEDEIVSPPNRPVMR